MNILIVDSWLREHIKTNAKPADIAKCLSLSSASVEKTEKVGDDYVYDIEVTTNRVDMMSVIGIARELSAALPEFGFKAEFVGLPKAREHKGSSENELLAIEIDKSLVRRVTAVPLEITVGASPKLIKDRLEASGIRSLNNVIDITNYIMREVGHPAHVFDLDRLNTKSLSIRESKKGEVITTLDGNTYELLGGDIVAEDDSGRVIDLLGIMGLENSVVTNDTKRILLFFDNNDPKRIRKTSMSLGIRTEAAVINEKTLDPELITQTLTLGVELYKKHASGSAIGSIIDVYPVKPKPKTVSVRIQRISDIIGVTISDNTIMGILHALSFDVKKEGEKLLVSVPSFRLEDIDIEEDIIEEVARIYGYHKIPNLLPPITGKEPSPPEATSFFWEERIKNALKYWGFSETYTYSFVSEELYEGPTDSAVKLANPLSNDHVYMRRTLIPSLLEVIEQNRAEYIKIFELANVYLPRDNDLPDERLHLAGVIKHADTQVFFEVKGVIEQLLHDLGMHNFSVKTRKEGGGGADIYVGTKQIGDIEILTDETVNFEIDFLTLLEFVSNEKVYSKISEFPPIIEDIRISVKEGVEYARILATIQSQSDLIRDVSLIDEYEDKMTFRITYQSTSKNLSNDDVSPLRKKVASALKEKLRAKIG